MKKTLQLVLTLSGLTALCAKLPKEFQHVETSKTWAEAQSYCREAFTDLATVENEDENKRLLSALKGRGEFAWIGLYDDLTRWKWSLGNADFSSATDFEMWKSNEPNNLYSKENCTVMTVHGTWRDYLCRQKRPSVCYDKSRSRFILVKSEKTWHQALRNCRSKYTDLATVRTRSDNAKISKMLSTRAWIGLHRDRWAHWSDQSSSDFTNWNESEPDNGGAAMSSCAAVNTTTGTWFDVDCQATHHFICQKTPEQHKMRLRLKFKSEAELSDPSVQQQILEQLHTNLQKHELSDFKLRWTETDGQIFHKEKQSDDEEGLGG